MSTPTGESAGGIMDRLRQPEYTGVNRCMPCTVVNSIITVLLAGAVGGALFSTTSVEMAGVGALAMLVIGAGAIYFRGYLVPGTPELTKRYMPERVLRWFGKAPVEQQLPYDPEEAVDPETIFLEIGIVEEGDDDLVIADDFESAWIPALVELRDEPLEEPVAELVERDEIDLECGEDGCIVSEDDQPISRWDSEAAIRSDLVGAKLLSERYGGWDDLPMAERGRLLNGLRTFLPECPDCAGGLSFTQETVESCCGTADVIALRCTDCEAHLLEVPVPEE